MRVFPRDGSGSILPTRVLSGGNTQLDGPVAIAVDGLNDEVFVLNFFSNAVTVYPRTASGNTVPLRVVAGANTGLSNVAALGIAASQAEILVANRTSITVYSRIATGNAAPLRTIAGSNTLLTFATSMAYDATNNEMFVGVIGNPAMVLVFPRTASGNVNPSRTLRTICTNDIGVAIDAPNGELYVSCLTLTRVYARTASGNASHIRSRNTESARLIVNGPAGEVSWLMAGSIITRSTSLTGPTRTITDSGVNFQAIGLGP
jgi:hypothetical protein